ncbi:KEOPS complex subunit Pcc1 [Halalkalicoccus sp. NIPERK01]|uniref:KEOPS complex subunit Pcc1 n=1 Tax=Halalkalicoccus sp. NIPERK01 TaxID=3053469 RepID=UPI00256EA998|nr:KEOPS complex subunit Pcc1 [Halalkalicoccus sp. NIPERK01]MDL5360518.1 KEOPS complex subunit Pcc1 [Halalkalicoccus sp. NIPERK01]
MKRIEIRTTHADPDLVARAVSPDNTPEIETRTEGGWVVTTITRESTGGLRTTADDYVVNLTVADEVVQLADQRTTTQS